MMKYQIDGTHGLLNRICVLIALVLLVSAKLTNWPEMSDEIEVARRTQRDVSYPIPIDQDTDFGVSLSTMVFDKYGYNSTGLLYVQKLLDVGAGILSIDVYYNNFTSKWQLCPAPYPLNQTTDITASRDIDWNNKVYSCQPDFTIDSIMNEIVDYIGSTNTNMDANYIKLLYNLKSFEFPHLAKNSTVDWNKIFSSSSSPYNQLGNSSLSDTVGALGSYFFSPTNLDSFRNSTTQSSAYYNTSNEEFPTLENFIFLDLKRVTAIIVSDEVTPYKSLYNLTSQDQNTFFMDNHTMETFSYNNDNITKCLTVVEDLTSIDGLLYFDHYSLKTHFRFVHDTPNLPFDDHVYDAMIRCGYSPILNASAYTVDDNKLSELGEVMDHFIPWSFWSWSGSHDLSLLGNASNNDTNGDDNTQVAEKCVLVERDGWRVGNCYHTYHYACKSANNPNDWKVLEHTKLYFDAYTDGSCPSGYSFGLPRLSIEMLALLYAIENDDDESRFPVWIDVNDVTVTSCFVSGGPYAECPYHKTVSTSALAGMIAPSFVVAVVVLVLIFLEKVARSNPIQTNRKRFWKKKINDFNKNNDDDGVPS